MDDVGMEKNCGGAQACCAFCIKTEGCDRWAWHGYTKECHAHGKGSSPLKPQEGTYSAIFPPAV